MSLRLAFLTVLAVALVAPSVGQARTYYGIVGPGHTITFTNSAGVRVSRVPAGYHRIVVRDRAADHNFRLRGRGVSRATGLAFIGTRTWSVRVYRGSIYRYVCDPHADHMRGSFRAV